MSDPWVADMSDGASPPTDVLYNTQLEDVYTRYLLPCFDTPLYKANFSVAVELPEHLTVLSNMPELSSNTTTVGRNLVTFMTTPRMPTYTLAVVAGKLKARVSNITTFNSSMQIRVWGPASMDVDTRMAGSLAIAEAAYSFYTSYTGLPLPLPKLDLVAVPGKGYAMENWGLLTFDTERFLSPAVANASARELFEAADVICHEMAHQWFGNWVTCRDWDNLALNEGAASYMEYDCIGAVLQYLLSTPGSSSSSSSSSGQSLSHSLDARSLAEALRRLLVPPLGMPPGTHEGVLSRARWADENPQVGVPLDRNADSVLVYSKAAAILDAAAGLAGQDGLQAAFQEFLNSYMYDAATVSDLVRSIAGQIAARWNGTGLADRAAVETGIMSWFTTPGVALLSAADVTPAPPPPPPPPPSPPPPPPSPQLPSAPPSPLPPPPPEPPSPVPPSPEPPSPVPPSPEPPSPAPPSPTPPVDSPPGAPPSPSPFLPSSPPPLTPLLPPPPSSSPPQPPPPLSPTSPAATADPPPPQSPAADAGADGGPSNVRRRLFAASVRPGRGILEVTDSSATPPPAPSSPISEASPPAPTTLFPPPPTSLSPPPSSPAPPQPPPPFPPPPPPPAMPTTVLQLSQQRLCGWGLWPADQVCPSGPDGGPSRNSTYDAPSLICPGVPDSGATTAGATRWWLPVPVSEAGAGSGGLNTSSMLLMLNSSAGPQNFLLSYGLPSDKWVLRRPGITGLYVAAYGAPASGSGTAHLARLLLAIKYSSSGGFGAAAAPPDRLAAVQDAQSVLLDVIATAFSLPASAAKSGSGSASGSDPFRDDAALLLPAGSVPGAAAIGNSARIPAVLAAIDAALTSPLAQTGAGLYALAQPALLALDYLQNLLATAATSSSTSATCNSNLQSWVLRRLGPLAAGVYNKTIWADSVTDRYLLRLAQANVVTEAAVWGDPGARDFACGKAASLLTGRLSSAGAEAADWMPAALAVPLGAPGGCNVTAVPGAPLPEVAFNSSLEAMLTAADPEVLIHRLFALSYVSGDTGLRDRLVAVLQAGAALRPDGGGGGGGDVGNVSALGDGVRPLTAYLAAEILVRLVGAAQRNVFFRMAAAGTSSSGTNSAVDVLSNDLLAAVLAANATNDGVMGLMNAIAGGNAATALRLLEAVVGRSLTTQSQMSAVRGLLCRSSTSDNSTSSGANSILGGAMFTTGVAQDKLATARSRILGRAQSRLQWIAKFLNPICGFLSAEATALAAAGSG